MYSHTYNTRFCLRIWIRTMCIVRLFAYAAFWKQRIGGNPTKYCAGSYALNPATGAAILVLVANYVLGTYGTHAHLFYLVSTFGSLNMSTFGSLIITLVKKPLCRQLSHQSCNRRSYPCLGCRLRTGHLQATHTLFGPLLDCSRLLGSLFGSAFVSLKCTMCRQLYYKPSNRRSYPCLGRRLHAGHLWRTHTHTHFIGPLWGH
jgi:hypothetical protein